jgi:hypothetical protein
MDSLKKSALSAINPIMRPVEGPDVSKLNPIIKPIEGPSIDMSINATVVGLDPVLITNPIVKPVEGPDAVVPFDKDESISANWDIKPLNDEDLIVAKNTVTGRTLECTIAEFNKLRNPSKGV